MRGSRHWLRISASALVFATGCAVHYDMAREPTGGWCPRRAPASGFRFSPPGVNRLEAPEVTWYSHPSVRDQEANSAWCETVGPPTVIGAPHPGLLSVTMDTLTLLAWNAWVGGGELKEFMRAELGLACGEGGPLPQSGFKPFVLLVQEAYQRSNLVPEVPKDAPVPWVVGSLEKPSDALDIVGVARACGLALAYVPSARNGPDSDGALGEDKGNAILSSLPLGDVIAVELPFEAGRKVAVGAEIDLPDGAGKLVAVSVHLDVASTLVRTLKTGNRTRERQVNGLLEALALHGWADGAAVVGGDFNTWSSHDAALKAMLRDYPDSPPIAVEGSRGPFPTDHIFLREDPQKRFLLVPSSYRTVSMPHGSDHRARVLQLSVRRRLPDGAPSAAGGYGSR